MNRIRSLRLSKGLTQDELVARIDRMITKQALSKYENDKATPSPKVAVALARALSVKPSRLFAPPAFHIRFVTYRQGPSPSAPQPTPQQRRLACLLAEELEHRLLLRERIGLVDTTTLLRTTVTTLEDAEDAAVLLRQQWQLGTDPIAHLTDLLERHNVHVVPVAEEPGPFHGIAAFALDDDNLDDDNEVRGAGVAYKSAAAGERQRSTLAYALARLVMDVSSEDPVFVNRAAHRFAGSLLMPADELTYLLGRSRTSLSLQELLLLKKHFGVSLQAVVQRAKDLEIVSGSFARTFFKQASQEGWRTQEPEPLPPEASQLWPYIVRRAAAQGQLTREEALRWGAEEAVPAAFDLSDPRALLKLPKKTRDALMAKQAAQAQALYKPGSHLVEWTEDYFGDVVEVDDVVGAGG